MPKKVVIAMSGGVDSSVAAALLQQQGYEVTGMMLRLWSEPGKETFNRCCSPDSMAQARRVAEILDISFYAIDAKEIFRSTVVQSFLDGYAHGLTPNPCLICNRMIKWGFLLDHAQAMGADFLATGHYARKGTDEQGHFQLLRAIDSAKDQSYALYQLSREKLAQALFPVGDYKKSDIRRLAAEFHLPTASRSDSQDLCFLGDNDYRDFLKRNAPEAARSGNILSKEGKLLGTHHGLAYYTIGQRKGLQIPSSCPLYVIEKDIPTNTLIVGPADELGRTEATVTDVHWVSGERPAFPLRIQAKIRYTSKEAWCTLTLLDENHVRLRFEELQRDITPGQAAVFYQGEVVLGGGLIDVADRH